MQVTRNIQLESNPFQAKISQPPMNYEKTTVSISNVKEVTQTCKLILPSCVTTLTYRGR